MTVADSTPRNEYMVSAAAAATAEKVDGYAGGTIGAKWLQLAEKTPTVPMAVSGISFSAVVTVWKRPAPWMPRRLNQVISQSPTMAMAPDSAALAPAARAPAPT